MAGISGESTWPAITEGPGLRWALFGPFLNLHLSGGAGGICALFDKRTRRLADVPIRYVGFEIPNRFVIGYGLDFAERYRNLPFIAVLKDPSK